MEILERNVSSEPLSDEVKLRCKELLSKQEETGDQTEQFCNKTSTRRTQIHPNSTRWKNLYVETPLENILDDMELKLDGNPIVQKHILPNSITKSEDVQTTVKELISRITILEKELSVLKSLPSNSPVDIKYGPGNADFLNTKKEIFKTDKESNDNLRKKLDRDNMFWSSTTSRKIGTPFYDTKLDADEEYEDRSKTFVTTYSHFKVFEREVRYWISRFGLLSYEVEVCHWYANSKSDTSWYGSTNVDHEASFVRIILNKNYGRTRPSWYDVSLTAFHEVCEVLLFKLRVAVSNYYSQRVCNEFIHEVIVTLQTVVFVPYWEREGMEKIKQELSSGAITGEVGEGNTNG